MPLKTKQATNGIPVYDAANWYRVGRGWGLQFFATDDEIQDWLLTALPSEYKPYTLVGSDPVEVEPKRFVWKGFEFSIGELKKAMYENARVRRDYFIRSAVLTPELDFTRTERIDATLSFSGLINLQHGSYLKYPWNEGLAESSISIVSRVANETTGAFLQHDEYMKIYKALNRKIKKHLCYYSIAKNRDGIEGGNMPDCFMTQGVVDQCAGGVKYFRRPGSRIV